MNFEANLLNAGNNTFSLSGECPHCKRQSVFMPVTSVHADRIGNVSRLTAAMRCQGCSRFILGIAKRTEGTSGVASYIEHYPLGKPNDQVPAEIPDDIAAAYKEAIRCLWVDAYNASVEMCRRAIEASCIEQGAKANLTIFEKIEWLRSEGKITEPLKDAAHKIRLGGNLGGHPPADPVSSQPIRQEEAEAVIAFMGHFFEHVYVMPKSLAKYDFSKGGRTKTP